ncbi:UBX domain protein Ubx2 [Elasticomyces elasticus]|uniref:UBX domain protein Ubx2 n=1 Tax=Exophiala sideris TaxID=1016849 RepID=A0ABR0J9C8_9EURO|nr:UBX domain protein Ubx2 [Elasticomyces elasticus]KAK5020999.1 UBX domain protein Ubx2 [Exophiala sideris]KAK5023308.1 UBX domain protein Ubx2 [Exophiala sideris]KAK5059339.1 UBX domain protein Ubx2 [Exophiala sideris]KAK5176158.1 UBX domain protein Ubx2 [Eurotiomycetes sp. CCFEE 6388]
MDEAIASVVMVTGTTPELAAQYVQLADGDPNQAVQLFFENGGADLTGPSSHPPPPSSSHPAGGADNPIDIDAEENISDDNDPDVTGFRKTPQNNASSRPLAAADYEDDEAMARRLQEEMYGGGGMDEGVVRAPIARQAETLVGPGADALPGLGVGGPDHDAAIQERMLAFQRRRNQPRPGIFNQHEPSSIWDRDMMNEGPARDYLAEATGGASEASSRSTRLARLFQPPWELMFKGEWDDARDEGKEHKKWILVDIQDPSIFDCQALNRDLWKNEGIVDTLKENFLFIQYNKDDPRAGQYIQYYFQDHDSSDAYPHVAIVDPRTGEQIKLWSRKVPTAPEFLMQIHEFLDRYSLDNSARNPVAKRKSEAKKDKPVDQLSEEEMLERALQASLATQTQEQPQPPPNEDPDDLTRSIGDLRQGGGPSIADVMDVDVDTNGGAATAETTAFSQIPSDHPHVEPPAGPGITRVQIRHPGGRIVRRFAEDDQVQRIYEYLKAEPLDGREGADFELVSMGKNLIDSRQESFEAAGLKNGTVMVEFVE